MILRRVIAHVRKQEWTAIGIDFVIVVVGVFVGIQVANWNEARVERQRERMLLVELRGELAGAIRQTQSRRKGYEQVVRAGERAVAFLDKGQVCGDECWPVIVDFFHASQWQALNISLPTYEEMRRNGWPRKREIVDAMEAYKQKSQSIAKPLDQPPEYRSLVRGLIPLAIHRPYWTTCFELTDLGDAYREDCPAGVPADVSTAGVDAIMKDGDIHRHLTQWAGFLSNLPETMDDQNDTARRALVLIEAELGVKP
ncbi:MAG: hypothetical protein LH470_04810 [Lysobacter sp.]|nr:hypothetical protein [Lysobacter sp.]